MVLTPPWSLKMTDGTWREGRVWCMVTAAGECAVEAKWRGNILLLRVVDPGGPPKLRIPNAVPLGLPGRLEGGIAGGDFILAAALVSRGSRMVVGCTASCPGYRVPCLSSVEEVINLGS